MPAPPILATRAALSLAPSLEEVELYPYADPDPNPALTPNPNPNQVVPSLTLGDATPDNQCEKILTPRTRRNTSEVKGPAEVPKGKCPAKAPQRKRPRPSSHPEYSTLFGPSRPPASWACSTCTYVHEGTEATFLVCKLCFTKS